MSVQRRTSPHLLAGLFLGAGLVAFASWGADPTTSDSWWLLLWAVGILAAFGAGMAFERGRPKTETLFVTLKDGEPTDPPRIVERTRETSIEFSVGKPRSPE